VLLAHFQGTTMYRRTIHRPKRDKRVLVSIRHRCSHVSSFCKFQTIKIWRKKARQCSWAFRNRIPYVSPKTKDTWLLRL